MKVFTKGGPENTREACEIALAKAKELGCGIVCATTTGETARTMTNMAEEAGFGGKLVFVTHTYGSRKPGENPMPEEVRSELTTRGVSFVTATHLLSGAERGLSKRHQGVYPVEIMADTLRLICAGAKVCVECASMALDSGAIPYGTPIVAVGGTGRGADTVVVMTPGHGNDILSTRIHEFLCKPY